MDDAGDESTGGSTTGRTSPTSEHAAVDRDAMIAHVTERARKLREREVETAISKLEANGELTEAQREAVEEMAEGIVEELLSTPATAMREADEGTLRAAMDVYGIDADDVEEW